MPCPPKMAGCKRDCRHRQMVHEYRAARAADEAMCEQVCAGYDTEHANPLHKPMITFKAWLEAIAQ